MTVSTCACMCVNDYDNYSGLALLCLPRICFSEGNMIYNWTTNTIETALRTLIIRCSRGIVHLIAYRTVNVRIIRIICKSMRISYYRTNHVCTSSLAQQIFQDIYSVVCCERLSHINWYCKLRKSAGRLQVQDQYKSRGLPRYSIVENQHMYLFIYLLQNNVIYYEL